MRKGLPIAKSEMTDETDFTCTYCESPQDVQSGRCDAGLALFCSGCGRHGKAEATDGTISTGPFFTHAT